MSSKPTVVITTSMKEWQQYIDECLSTAQASELLTLLLADVDIVPAELAPADVVGAISLNEIAASATSSSLPQIDLIHSLNPPEVDHFLTNVFMIHRFNQIEKSLSVKSLILFHSQYKYLFMSYSQTGYRQSGKMIASAYQVASLVQFAQEYKEYLLKILSQMAKRGDQVNTLSHLQGYFKKRMTSTEKADLTSTIGAYQQQQISLFAPIELLSQLLVKYPDNYLSEQHYFLPYPSANQLRKLL